MSKYRIIDAEKLGSHWTLWERLEGSEFMLSEEETMAKFASIYNAGEKSGYNEGKGYNEIPSLLWTEIKKTL